MARVKPTPKKREEQRQKRENPEKKKEKKQKTVPADPEPAVAGKKRRRDRDGRGLLRQIKSAQRSTDTMIPRSAIKRLIKEIANDCSTSGGVRFTPNAISAIQVAAEDHLVSAFRDGQHLQCNISDGSKTLRPPAFKAASQLRPGNTISLPRATIAKPGLAPVADIEPETLPSTEVATGNDSE